ncbi:MAG: asparagine synthase (glutamine-hydrolyzing) [Rhodospirillales bacterium]|nr:asparagine synthase (glutamine-hydrolyzing) [Rhodospirillales bacterium]
MCGIVGIVGEQDWEWIGSMNETQFHRGPDDGGEFTDRENMVSLAMRRLSIIDVQGGEQPITSPDGRFTIVYNGEVFNAPELRSELKAKKVAFVSDHSDTEVLFNLLQHEGVGCLSRLNGMFAFALWDRQKREILLARDRFGIKPLHYFQRGKTFAFASEIKSLLKLPSTPNAVDFESIYHYFSLLYVPGENTAYCDVKKVPPGSYLKFSLDDRVVTVERYWEMSFAADHGRSRTHWCEAIRAELGNAVKRWAWSDVPVAMSLSGGLDSSAIAGLLAQQGVGLKSFSLGFSGNVDEPWNELPLAKKVAEKWGIEHEEIVLNPTALLDELPQMIAALDEPYGGGLPSWFVFKGMAAEYKVAITGSGGDELFGNYGKWRGIEAQWMGRFGRRKPSNVSEEIFRSKMFDEFYYATDKFKHKLFTDPNLGQDATSELLRRRFDQATARGAKTVRDAHAVMDIGTQLSDEFLFMTDRFSMAHSLEARTPFLDNGFVDLVSQIPAEMRTSGSDLKGLLRDSVAPLLPGELVHAPKKGFVIPLAHWLRTDLTDLVGEYLGEAKLKSQGIFDHKFVARHVREHRDGKLDHTHFLWPMLMFQLWYAQ